MATQFPTYALTLEGSDAITAVTDPLYATAAQGALADTATQPADLATVATTGAYTDLSGTPTLGTAAAADSTDFATAAQGVTADAAVEAVSTLTKLYGPITQAAYDGLTPDADTLYVIVG